MAGRRHHYIPRFLQRPFAHRQNGKEFYVYAHHREHGPYTTNIMKLGQERDFYGGPDDTTLDDEITQDEQQLAITLQKISNGEQVSSASIASLIAALSFRTKTMRKALTDLIPHLMNAGRSHLLEGRQLQDKLDQSLRDPKKRRELIYKHIREKMGHLKREEQAKVYALMLPKWKTFVQENEGSLLAQARTWIAVALDRVMEKTSEIGDEAFLNALAQGPSMPERAKRLDTEMVFEIWDAPEGEHFILGDCGTVGLFTDGKPRLALGSMDEDVELEFVFLPISPSRCVVARKPAAIRSVSVWEINRMSASVSREFFISDQHEETEMQELREAIGTLDPIATREEIARVLTRE